MLRFCPTCGSSVDDSDVFCSECGAGLDGGGKCVSVADGRNSPADAQADHGDEGAERGGSVADNPGADASREVHGGAVDLTKGKSLLAIVVGVIALVLVAFALGRGSSVENSPALPSASLTASASALPSAVLPQIGDERKFGRYPHDASGNERDIDWIVVAVDKDTQCFDLLSKFVLDAHCYDFSSSNVWSSSSLKLWLNDDFYKRAFNQSEREQIKAVSGSNVSLLDSNLLERFFKRAEDRVCSSTPYAESKGADGGTCSWWLCERIADSTDECVACDYEGNDVATVVTGKSGVRPLVRVRLQ